MDMSNINVCLLSGLSCNRLRHIRARVLCVTVFCCCFVVIFYGYYSNDVLSDNSTWPLAPLSNFLHNDTDKDNIDASFVNFSFNYTSVGGGKFYIFSVISEQSPRGASNWSSIVINGWEEKDAYPITYKCCYKYSDGSYKSTSSSGKRSWNPDELLKARQIICNINNIARPEVVSLVLPEDSCDNGSYQAPLYRMRYTEPKFAICAKIAYGKKNPVEIIEWMEYHLLFGVSKVVMYPYGDLNEGALSVLQHYAQSGILEIVPMPYVPQLDKFPRYFSESYNRIMWQDEHVTTFDAQERLKQFKYYTLIDTDEFITQTTKENRNFVKLMELLTSNQNTTASFTMFSEIHLLDWAKTNNDSVLKMGQYGSHTEPVLKEPKLLHVTNRLLPGSVWIHTSGPAAGFKSGEADPGIVVLKHFRLCKALWVPIQPCHNQFAMFNDTLLFDKAKLIEQRVLYVKRKLHLV